MSDFYGEIYGAKCLAPESKFFGQWYVGQTQRNTQVRHEEHLGYAADQNFQCVDYEEALYLYGEEAFDLQLLEQDVPNIDRLNELEILWIARKDSFHNGMNRTVGGGGYVQERVPCRAEDCNRVRRGGGHGYCKKCYRLKYNRGAFTTATCKVEGCERHTGGGGRGYCRTCHTRENSRGAFTTQNCKEDGCDGPKYCKGYCSACYQRVRFTGGLVPPVSHDNPVRMYLENTPIRISATEAASGSGVSRPSANRWLKAMHRQGLARKIPGTPNLWEAVHPRYKAVDAVREAFGL